MGYTRRQLVNALLVANAVRPPRGRLGVLGFAFGWPTIELAPHILGLTALDTAQAVARRRADRTGLALAALSGAGLAYLIGRARRTGELAEAQLVESLGDGYLDELTEPPGEADLKTPLRDLLRPFRLNRPDVERIADIHYTEGGSRSLLDVYRPRGRKLDRAPVLFQVHGGAWTIGDKSQQGLILMNRMAARGWVCVASNYRLAPKHPWPTQVVDVKRALAWIRDHIEEYGGDPSYVVITGGSAGGHLASLTALTEDDPDFQPGFEDADTRVAACVSFYGVYDLADLTGDKAVRLMRDAFLARRVFPKDATDEDYEKASPLAHVHPDAPDFFVIHGDQDGLVTVRQARTFVKRMREVSKGVVTYLELPGTQHAFEVFSSIRSQHVIRAVERWLEWHRATRREATRDATGTAEPARAGSSAAR